MNRTIAPRIAEPQTGLPDCIRSLTDHEVRRYSYSRAVRFLLRGRQPQERGLEGEVSDALIREHGGPAEFDGMRVPWCLQERGLVSTSGAAGGYLAGVDVGDIVTLLRSKLVLGRLGSPVLLLPHVTSLPVRVSASTASWVQEDPGSDAGESDSSFGVRTLLPHSLIVNTSLSSKLALQSHGTAEALLRNDLSAAVALAIDTAAFSGSGLENQPLSILKTTGIGDVAYGADGGVPGGDQICDLELAVSQKNADLGNLAFASTPGIRALLRRIPQFTGSSVPLWDAGEVLGYPALASSVIPSTLDKGAGAGVGVCHAIVFADWSQILPSRGSRPGMDTCKRPKLPTPAGRWMCILLSPPCW